MKKFAVFDIDGTVIRWQLFHGVFGKIGKNGHYQQGEYEKIRAARIRWKNRHHEESFKEYEKLLVQAGLASLPRIPTNTFERIVDEVFDEYKDQVYRYTRDKIKDLKQQGYTLLAISGSPAEIVGRFAAYYGFDDFIGVTYLRANGTFTGESLATIGKKADLLRELVAKHGLDFTNSIGFGDSEGDIGMLELVEQPVAFNPDKKLFEHARRTGWDIVVERKNVAYQLHNQDGSYVLQ